MSDLATKLYQLAPLFSEILKSGAGLGLSIGVVHHGQVIYKSHLGQLQASSPDPPNDDTMYYVASLTKAITSAAVAILVEQDRLKWDTPLAEYFAEFQQRDDEVGQKATTVDVLSHRTGLTGANAFWVQREQEFMMPKQETVRTAGYLKNAIPFRQHFNYNNWGYGVATALIEQTTGITYGSFAKENIFEPLGLKRTTIDVPDASNVSSANIVQTDGSICPIKPPPNSDRTGLAGAGGGKASFSDLLQLYKSFLSAYKAEQNHTHDPGSPLRQVRYLFEEKVRIGDADIKENAYALGWVKTVLPQRLGLIGLNAMYMGEDNMPLIGNSSPGNIVLHHHGNLVGALSSVHLVPESDTAIVVLSNTLGFADTMDWIGQLILQTVIGEDPYDYKEWAEKAKAAHFKQYSDLVDELEKGKTNIPPSHEFHAYCGRYYNSIGNFLLEITTENNGNGLVMKVQSYDDVVYHLLPYDGNTFYWPCDRDHELCTEMMFPWPWAGVHKISFEMGPEGSVQSLSWGHDPVVGPEIFMRDAGAGSEFLVSQ